MSRLSEHFHKVPRDSGVTPRKYGYCHDVVRHGWGRQEEEEEEEKERGRKHGGYSEEVQAATNTIHYMTVSGMTV